jgi:hypothetical protein
MRMQTCYQSVNHYLYIGTQYNIEKDDTIYVIFLFWNVSCRDKNILIPKTFCLISKLGLQEKAKDNAFLCPSFNSMLQILISSLFPQLCHHMA